MSTNSNDESTTTPPTLIFLPAEDLRAGHVLVGDSGGRSLVVENARPDSLLAGLVTVETEHGFLLLDSDREQTFAVVAS